MTQTAESSSIVKAIAALIEEQCGLNFSGNDLPSLQQKIMDRLDDIGVSSLARYHALLLSRPGGEAELRELFNHVTINETFFLRGPEHFRVFAGTVLPEFLQTRNTQQKLRILSAGCSTGEEVYSLAMSILDNRCFDGWDIRILGTDINDSAIGRARQGIYRGRSIQNVPPDWLRRYFQPAAGQHQVLPEVRRICHFVRHNMMAEPFPEAPLDVVFLRNVMIYFHRDTCQSILARLHRDLAGDGWLFIGAAETIWQIESGFSPHYYGDCFVYRKKPSARSAIPASPPAGASRQSIVPTGPARPRQQPSPEPPPGESSSRPPASRDASAVSAGAEPPAGLPAIRQMLREERFAEARRHLDALPDLPEVLYLRCAVYASLDDEGALREALNKLLALDPLHLEARCIKVLHLMGRGKLAEARSELQPILFADEDLLLPRYLQMILLEKDGRAAAARQEARALIRLIEGGRWSIFKEDLYGREISSREVLRQCQALLSRS